MALWVSAIVVVCALVRLGVSIERQDFDEDVLLACATVAVTVWLTIRAAKPRRRRGS